MSLTYSRGSRGPSIHKTEGNSLLKTDKSFHIKQNGKTGPSMQVKGHTTNGETEMSYVQDFEVGFGKDNTKSNDVAL